MKIKDVIEHPIWSSVIASGVVLVLGLLAKAIKPNWYSSVLEWFQTQTQVPNLVVALIILIALLILVWVLNRKPIAAHDIRESDFIDSGTITSQKWFSEIESQIKDCKFARIYLRDFDHPDQFRPEHRSALLSFMQSLALRLESGADIEIIAYHFRESEKSGLDWLRSEVTENPDSLKKIKLIKTQPVSNSSSMYLFDSGNVLYNRRVNDQKSYHIDNFQGSIVHHFIERGYRFAKGKMV